VSVPHGLGQVAVEVEEVVAGPGPDLRAPVQEAEREPFCLARVLGQADASAEGQACLPRIRRTDQSAETGNF
jgi:hypothetical protein